MKTILTTSKKSSLYWSPTPPPKAGEWKPVKITEEILWQKYGVIYSEEIVVADTTPLPKPILNPAPAKLPEKIEKEIEENVKKLVICDMGNGLGAGVFTREKICKGTHVFIYNGVVLPLSYYKDMSDFYCLRINIKDTTEEFVISPRKRGNIARFAQDLPAHSDNQVAFNKLGFLELDASFILNPDLKDKIATANITMKRCYIKWNNMDFEVPIFIANRDIQAYEMLGFTYGNFMGYWSNMHGMRRFFNKNYSLVPSNLHHCKTSILLVGEKNRCSIQLNELMCYFEKDLILDESKKHIHRFTFYSGYIAWLFYNKAADKTYKRLNFRFLIDKITTCYVHEIKLELNELIKENNFERKTEEETRCQAEHIYTLPDDLARIFGAACIRMSHLSKDKKIVYLLEAQRYFTMLGDTKHATSCAFYIDSQTPLPLHFINYFLNMDVLTLHHVNHPIDYSRHTFLQKDETPKDSISVRGEHIKK